MCQTIRHSIILQLQYAIIFFFILCDYADARRLVQVCHLSFVRVASKATVQTSSLFCFFTCLFRLYYTNSGHAQGKRSRIWRHGFGLLVSKSSQCVCVCVCAREREREWANVTESETESDTFFSHLGNPMEQYGSGGRRRRRRPLIIIGVVVVALLIIVVVAVAVSLKQQGGKDVFQSTFMARCKKFQG